MSVPRVARFLSSGSKIGPILPLTIHLIMSGEFLSIITWAVGELEGRCFWHLVGRGPRCCLMSYNVQNSLLHQRIIQFKISVWLRWRNLVQEVAYAPEKLDYVLFQYALHFPIFAVVQLVLILPLWSALSTGFSGMYQSSDDAPAAMNAA